MDKTTDLRQMLRAQLIENAAEINRLLSRVHETYAKRDESKDAWQDWSRACAEAHSRYDQLWLPGGPHENFLERLQAGEPAMVEVALCFLEVRPYFFRSGYHWKTILRKCKRASMSAEQSARLQTLLAKYTEWRVQRRESSARGAAVRSALWPLARRFYDLFPARLPDLFDGVTSIGDLYRVLCTGLKVEPLAQPEISNGKARKPFPKSPTKDMTAWGRNYASWRHSSWLPEDVWATLAEAIREVYQIDDSVEITPAAVLLEPRR